MSEDIESEAAAQGAASDRPFPHLAGGGVPAGTEAAPPVDERTAAQEQTVVQQPEGATQESTTQEAVPPPAASSSPVSPAAVVHPEPQPHPPQQPDAVSHPQPPSHGDAPDPQQYDPTTTAPQPAAWPNDSQQQGQSGYPPQAYPQQPYGTDPTPVGYGQQPSGAGGAQVRTGPTDNSAAASLICGIVGVIFSCAWGIGGVLGMIAVIMGMNARRRLRKPGCTFRGEGMALTGIITGWIAVGLGLIVLGVFTLLAVTAGS